MTCAAVCGRRDQAVSRLVVRSSQAISAAPMVVTTEANAISGRLPFDRTGDA
jgi:hypothetical protein